MTPWNSDQLADLSSPVWSCYPLYAHIFYCHKFIILDNVFPHTLQNISHWFCINLIEVKGTSFISNWLKTNRQNFPLHVLLLDNFFPRTWHYMEINCEATPRFIATCRGIDPIFAEQHILVAFQLFIALSLISTLQSLAIWTSSTLWQKTEFNLFGKKKDFLPLNDTHLSLQYLWSWVDCNSLLI